MDITITFGSWMIPVVITIVSCGYALFHNDGSSGYMSGVGNIIMMVPALFISMLAWMLWGIIK